MQIACLHTAGSNRGIFDAALDQLRRPDVALRHCVRPDLLTAVLAEEAVTPRITRLAVEILLGLAAEADAVLLTCSTLGPAADQAAARTSVPILRADRALATHAVREGGKVVVLIAIEATRSSTQLVFETAAGATGAEILMRLVPGAWAEFQAGRHGAYHANIARAADEAARSGASCVALAQVSMAGAAALAKGVPAPMEAPSVALLAAVEAVAASR